MHAYNMRQSIPVLALVPETKPETASDKIIAVLEAVSKLPGNCNVKLRASLPDAVLAFQLFASAKGLELADVETRENGLLWRTISLYSAETLSCLASLVYEPVEDPDQVRDEEEQILRARDEMDEALRRDEERREWERELFESTPRSTREMAEEHGVRQ